MQLLQPAHFTSLLLVLVVIESGFSEEDIRLKPEYQCRSPNVKGEGKTIPLQALTGPEGSRRLRLPDFKTIGT
jgi:hypothetical protein